MDTLASLPEPGELYRWTADEFMALIESGLIDEPRGVELMNGIIERTMPAGETHRLIFRALNQALIAAGAFSRGMEAIPPLILGTRYAIEPDFALLAPSSIDQRSVPRAQDVLWAIEVSDATLAKDLGRKKRAYAEAAIPHYWVFDAQRRGVWLFSRPLEGEYADARFAPAGEALTMPGLDGLLDTAPLFPTP